MRRPTAPRVHYNVGALLYARGDRRRGRAKLRRGAAPSSEVVPRRRLRWGRCFRAGRYADARARVRARARARRRIRSRRWATSGLTLQRRGRADLRCRHLRTRARARADSTRTPGLRCVRNLLLLGRSTRRSMTSCASRRGAPLSAELVVTGLMFSRLFGDPAYETKVLAACARLAVSARSGGPGRGRPCRALQYLRPAPRGAARCTARYDRLQQANRRRASASRQASAVRGAGDLSASAISPRIFARMSWDGCCATCSPRTIARAFGCISTRWRRRRTRTRSRAEFRALARARSSMLAEVDDPSRGACDRRRRARRARRSDGPFGVLAPGHPAVEARAGDRHASRLSRLHRPVRRSTTSSPTPIADLPDAASYQIEAPLALDCCVLPVRRVDAVAAAGRGLTRAGLGIEETAVVFGAFVSLLKLSPRCLELVARDPRAGAVRGAGVFARQCDGGSAVPQPGRGLRHRPPAA